MIQDTSKVGPSSDFYQVGVLLYELLTKTVPFKSKDKEELFD